jgi:broad specificity phosphatase PhoE
MSPQQVVYFTRHGQRIDAVNKQWKRNPEPGKPQSIYLSPHGIEQARALGRRLAGAGIATIFASPFYRCVETAHHVCEFSGGRIRIEHGVCEYLQPRYFSKPTLGVQPAAKLAKIFPAVDADYRTRLDPRPPESEADLARRTAEAIALLTASHPEPMLIISHGTVIRHMIWALLDDHPELNSSREGALTSIRQRDGRWSLEHDGDTAHLPPASPA